MGLAPPRVEAQEDGSERLIPSPATMDDLSATPDAQTPQRNAEPSMGRAGAVMSVGTALSRVTGFIRLSVMAWAIGGAESKLPDTYNLANSMPNMVYQLVVGEVLATLFVPVFVEHIKTRQRDEAWSLASSILNLALIVSGVFAALTVAFAPWIIKMWSFRVPGDDRAAFEATGAFFLRLFMPQMIFYATGMVLTGLLNAHRRFAAPMFAPLLNNLIAIATFITFKIVHTGALDAASLTPGEKLLLGGGTTLGVVAMTMALWPAVLALPGRFRFRELQWRHPAVRHVGALAKYSFGYVIVNQVGIWVVYALANATQGGVSAYQSSWILYQLPYGIFAVSVMTYLVPRMAEHHVDGDVAAVRNDVSLGLRTVAFIVLPAAAGFIALGRPIIRLLLEHGVFEQRSTALFADTFVLMAVGLGAYAAFQMLMRAFYAMQDTRTPLVVNILAVGVNIVTAIPLYRTMGVPGLALSHALSYAAGAIGGGLILRARLHGLDGARLLGAHARIGVASAATGAVAWLVARAVGDRVALHTFAGQITQVGVAVAAGLVAYVALARALRIQEFTALVSMIAGPLRRFRGQRGAVLLGWLVRMAIGFAIIAVVLFDAGAIITARFQVDGVAIEAANQAGMNFDAHESRTKAQRVADEYAVKHGSDLLSFVVDQEREVVIVRLSKRAPTLLLHRIGPLRRFATQEAEHEGLIR